MKLSDLYTSNPYQGNPNCVVAVVRRDGRWLLGKSTSGERKGYWCFPGGMIEDGESPEDAAVRECHEETGLMTKPEQSLGKIHYRCVAIMCVANMDGPLKANREFKELRWFSPDEAMRLDDLFPTNKELIAKAAGAH